MEALQVQVQTQQLSDLQKPCLKGRGAGDVAQCTGPAFNPQNQSKQIESLLWVTNFPMTRPLPTLVPTLPLSGHSSHLPNL